MVSPAFYFISVRCCLLAPLLWSLCSTALILDENSRVLHPDQTQSREDCLPKHLFMLEKMLITGRILKGNKTKLFIAPDGNYLRQLLKETKVWGMGWFAKCWSMQLTHNKDFCETESVVRLVPNPTWKWINTSKEDLGWVPKNLDVKGHENQSLRGTGVHSFLITNYAWHFDWMKNAHIKNNRFGAKEVIPH